MDTNPPVQQPDQPVIVASSGIFGTKKPSLIVFGIGVLLFFLPFIDIKCNRMSIKQYSGMELAIGMRDNDELRMKPEKFNGESGEGFFEGKSVGKNSNKRSDPNKFALAALLLGITGLLLSFANARTGGMGGIITGSLAALSLVLLFIDLKQKVKDSVAAIDDTGGEFSEPVKLSVEFAMAFWLAMAAFIGAAQLSYRRWKANER